jgi:hypothetical protein
MYEVFPKNDWTVDNGHWFQAANVAIHWNLHLLLLECYDQIIK